MAYSNIFPSKVNLRDDVNTLESSSVTWKGTWADGEYVVNDMVRDGEWSMIANATTLERPAPQPIGDEEKYKGN